jgi:hypothetical protein
MGKMAFVQSIHPYRGYQVDKVAIFGLDTEYIPRPEVASDLLSWQLAGKDDVLLTQKPLDIKTLYTEAKKMLHGKMAKVYVFVCFFSIAEIQFFDLADWKVSEFKGKYRLSQTYGDGRLMVVDLADWYQHKALKDVAKQWGLEKVEFDIGEKVEAVARGEMTKQDLFDDPVFREYAKMDAVLCQRIYSQMRDFFIKRFSVDIVSTMTPANTSASILRLGVTEPIVQENTDLRKLALECCWGGRMECLYRGTKERVFEYDATGHHPNSAIALGVLPLEKDWHKTGHLGVWMKGLSGLGKVYFKFPPTEKLPCLPVMMDDALVFPLEGVSCCSLSEARLALKKGAKLLLMKAYYYNSGTDILTRHLVNLQAMRNQSKDVAERELLKLLSNGVIGKLFQKKTGVDIAKVQAYAAENGIPVDEAIKLKGVDFGAGKTTVGSCFYPEWYALILGYARASIAEVGEEHGALIISSDSFVTEKVLESPFTKLGISFSEKAQGDLVSYRTRFYRVGDKLAHHAVHNREAGKVVLECFYPTAVYQWSGRTFSLKSLWSVSLQDDGVCEISGIDDGVFNYRYGRFLHLKESWKTKKPFGSRTFRSMTTSLDYDYKRKLLDDGTTVPWGSVEERLAFLSKTPIPVEEPYEPVEAVPALAGGA